MRSIARGVSHVVVVVALALSNVSADGGFFADQSWGDAGKPSSAAQKAVIIREGEDEVLLLQTTYRGRLASFAWVIPVPTVPPEVFEAEPHFMDAVFLHTNPRVQTRIREPMSFGRAKDEAGSAGGAEPADVTVHARLEVGDYDAAVLSAETASSLTNWLRDNGYAVPESDDASIEPYIAQQFAFVAVKLLPRVLEQRNTQRDLAPLGIRFKAERLFYPLVISRATAPELTSLLLCILSPEPVQCLSLPMTFPPKSTSLDEGATFGSFRRAFARTGGPHLLVEYCAQGGLPYFDLSYRASDWSRPQPTGLASLHATRLFGLLKPEEMVDFEFAPAGKPVPDVRLEVLRSVRVGSLWQHVAGLVLNPCGFFAAVMAMAVLDLLWVGWRGRSRRSGPGGKLLVVVLVLCCVRYAHSGIRGDLYNLPRTLQPVEEAIGRFQEDMGAFPSVLDALSRADAPTAGLDASGNEVELSGEWHGPYLGALPEAPLGKGFVYDVLNLRPVDDAAWRGQVRRRHDDRGFAGGRRFWDPPSHSKGAASAARAIQAACMGRVLVSHPLATNPLVVMARLDADFAARQDALDALPPEQPKQPGHEGASRQKLLAEDGCEAIGAHGWGFAPLAKRMVWATEIHRDRLTMLAGLFGIGPEGIEQVLVRRPMEYAVDAVWTSADGGSMLLRRRPAVRSAAPRVGEEPTMYLVAQSDAEPRALAGQWHLASFAPQGENAFLLGKPESGATEGEALCRMDPASGRVEVLQQSLDGNVLEVSEHGVLVTDSAGLVLLSADGMRVMHRRPLDGAWPIISTQTCERGVAYARLGPRTGAGGSTDEVTVSYQSWRTGQAAEFLARERYQRGGYPYKHDIPVALLGIEGGRLLVAWRVDEDRFAVRRMALPE